MKDILKLVGIFILGIGMVIIVGSLCGFFIDGFALFSSQAPIKYKHVAIDIVLITCGVVLFLLFSRAKKLWAFNVLMLWGAGLGFFMGNAALDIVDTYWHNGPGIIVTHDDERGTDSVDKVSECQYKRHRFVENGFIIVIGTFFWVGVTSWAKATYLVEKKTPADFEE